MKLILDNLKPLNELAFLSYKFQRDNAPDVHYLRWECIFPSWNLEHFELIYKHSKNLN